MKTTFDSNSFSARGGMRDVPRGAVPLRRNETQKVEKAPEKSRTGLLLVLLALSLLLLLSQYAAEIRALVNKPVQTVLMANPLQRVDEQNVREVLANHLSVGFFALDVQAIKTALEADPWVEKVTISRIWPDTLSVAITEEIAIARWGDSALLNQFGETFEPYTMEDDLALPLLNGPQGQQRRVMEQYQTFSQMLFSSGLRIRELSLNELGSWSLRLHNGAEVMIGRNEVVERMQRFVSLYDRHLYSQLDQIEAFDLRYNNGISIRKKTDMPVGIVSK